LLTNPKTAHTEPAPLLSVVICVRNGASFLPGLCDALLGQEEPPGGFEVIFVDDQSTDGTSAYLERVTERDRRLSIVYGRGLGQAAARNDGIARARGQFVALTDADVIPDRDWLVQTANVLESGDVRAVEGLVDPWSDNGSLSPLVRNVRNQDGGRFMTANMVYERSLLEELGGFDEAFRPPSFLEDTDIAFRTLDLGIDIPFATNVRVRHRDVLLTPGTALRSLGGLKWMALVARKHPARYEKLLRNKVQTLRPGDVDLLLGLLLLVATRHSPARERLLVLGQCAVALRRVLRVAEVGRVPQSERIPWLVVALVSPALRTLHLIEGWIRFRTVAL
jgi:glycosyltransferase involved in cell wall biosynthesis